MPAGIILFPITYVFGDVLTEVYGYSASRKVIWTGFFSLLVMVLSITIAQHLNPAPFWSLQPEFEHILGKVPRIVLASIIAFFCGEFANSFTLAKLKLKTKGKSMSTRFVLSTIIGQFIDTSVFVLIAFAGTMEIYNLIIVTASAWVLKVIWEVLALPISVPFVKWLKKVENEDYYDRETNFSPFKIS